MFDAIAQKTNGNILRQAMGLAKWLVTGNNGYNPPYPNYNPFTNQLTNSMAHLSRTSWQDQTKQQTWLVVVNVNSLRTGKLSFLMGKSHYRQVNHNYPGWWLVLTILKNDGVKVSLGRIIYIPLMMENKIQVGNHPAETIVTWYMHLKISMRCKICPIRYQVRDHHSWVEPMCNWEMFPLKTSIKRHFPQLSHDFQIF